MAENMVVTSLVSGNKWRLDCINLDTKHIVQTEEVEDLYGWNMFFIGLDEDGIDWYLFDAGNCPFARGADVCDGVMEYPEGAVEEMINIQEETVIELVCMMKFEGVDLLTGMYGTDGVITPARIQAWVKGTIENYNDTVGKFEADSDFSYTDLWSLHTLSVEVAAEFNKEVEVEHSNSLANLGLFMQECMRIGHCMDYEDFCIVMHEGEMDEFHMIHWRQMQKNFAKWYMSLDTGQIKRWVEYCEKQR